MMRPHFAFVLLLACLITGCGGTDNGREIRPLRIFTASGLMPALADLREDSLRELGIELLVEASGSQVACRKLNELGRDCDLIMLADSNLVATLLAGKCSWRIDLAGDEVVLGVGVRAPGVSAAEEDWVPVLLGDDVRLGRVDENLGPTGYRTLLVWKLQEKRGSAGLYDRLLKKCDKVMDHVTRLTALLKTGEVDYAFVYRSICIASDIRYIELDRGINLGASDVDYSHATVTYEKLQAGSKETMTIAGAPITWTLSIPDRGADTATAQQFVRYLLTRKAKLLDRNGFRPLARPLFYGPVGAHKPFEDFSQRVGELK